MSVYKCPECTYLTQPGDGLEVIETSGGKTFMCPSCGKRSFASNWCENEKKENKERSKSIVCPCCGQGEMIQQRIGGEHKCSICNVSLCYGCGGA